MRIPKLRGFRNRFKIEYEIVNVGDISARVDSGAFSAAGTAPKKGEPLTINADVLRAVGLVRDVRKPLKVLGGGELSAALFVVADAFTKSATEKIQAAGGSVNVLEVPTESRPALGVDGSSAETGAPAEATTAEPTTAEPSTAETARKSRGRSAASRPSEADEADEAATVADATASADASATAEDAAIAEEATSSIDEPAEEPDAVTEGSTESPVAGDESETDTAAPGDDA
jgi:hypothetical protein